MDVAESSFWGSSEAPVEDCSEALSSAALHVLLREQAEAKHGYGSAAYYRACEY